MIEYDELKEIICGNCKHKDDCEFKDADVREIDFTKCEQSKKGFGDALKNTDYYWLLSIVLLLFACWRN